MRKDLRKKVITILSKYPKARDSDAWLTIKLWCEFYPSLIIREQDENGQFLQPKIILDNILRLPKEDQCKRIRAIIQNVEGKYLPTTWEVAKKRKIEQEKWQAYVQQGEILFGNSM